jgi:spermidine synthase
MTQAWEELASTRSSRGDALLLRHRAGVYEIRCNGWDLMSNRAHASEEALALLALEAIRKSAPRVLIGGLGMGFTLRAALDAAPADARIEIMELLPEIVAWNRGPLAPLAGRPLDDARVAVRVGDVADALAAQRDAYDAILLDTDNGPGAVMLAGNARLYDEGLALARSALAPGGVIAVWSADRSEAFERRLRESDLDWRVVDAPATRAPCAPLHSIYLARRA